MKASRALFLTSFCAVAAMSCGFLDHTKSKSPRDVYVAPNVNETLRPSPIHQSGYLGELTEAEFKSREAMPCGYYYNAKALKADEYVTRIGNFKVIDSQQQLNLHQAQSLVGSPMLLADERGNGGWVIQCSAAIGVDFDRRV